jgi:hypothetical protein
VRAAPDARRCGDYPITERCSVPFFRSFAPSQYIRARLHQRAPQPILQINTFDTIVAIFLNASRSADPADFQSPVDRRHAVHRPGAHHSDHSFLTNATGIRLSTSA